jgi:hypothetical protein
MGGNHLPAGRTRRSTETTRAVRTHSLMLDYWKLNKLADDGYRARLGLE